MPYKVYQTHGQEQKVEPGSTEVEMADAAGTNGTGGTDSNGTEKTKNLPPWLSKIKEVGGIKKVPKTVLKRRRNFKLKRMLVPKSPSMLLYEVVGAKEVKFENIEVDKINKLMKIEATYDGKTFQGVGPNKSVAKNVCSEQILQHFVFKSCTKVKSEDGDVDMEGEGGASAKEDPTPWTALASLGLFKLFNDWQSQGVQLPPELLMGSALRQAAAHPEAGSAVPLAGPRAHAPNPGAAALIPTTPTVKDKKERKPKEPKQLPENPHMQHPVQLLNEMCGKLEYDCTAEGAPPSVVYKMTVIVNGSEFIGVSRNKKEAKKLAAQAAMTGIHNVQYPAV